MIDTMFQAGTDQALDDQIQRPQPAPPQQRPFSATALLKAPFQGIGAGTAESIGFGAELSGAFGDVLSATGTVSAGGMFSTQSEQERRDSEAARRRMLDGQTPYSNEAGDLFRARAAEIMPDPQTTHASAQVVAGLFKFGTKAVGYVGTGGPAGALGLGLDEGFTEADRLKQQGVDQGTRAAAGAVAGVVAGGSMLVPLSGASALTRFGKGVLVGEGSIVAQSAAEKAILDHAGYHQIASTFDPFDPVALGVGIVPGLIGAAFGHAPARAPAPRGVKPIADMGLGERQALPYNDTRLDAYAVQAAQREGIPPEALLAIKNAGEKSGSTATSPAGARGVMQFMPETWKQYGRGDITDPMNNIDAGARYMADLIKQYDGDVRAAIAHYNGGTRAGKAVRAGEAPPAAETQAYLQRADAYMHEQVGTEAGRAAANDPDVVAAARVRQVSDALDESRLTPDEDTGGRSVHQDAIEQAHEQMAAGEAVDVAGLVTDRYAYLFNDMEPKFAVPPESQGTLRFDAAGAPEIRSASVRLTDAHPTTRIEAVGEDLTRFAIRSPEGQVLGYADLALKDGKVVSLYDIETKSELRGQGIGAKVIEAITSLEPDRKIEISNIVDEAVPFWEKVGAQVSDGNRSPTLDWHQFADSPAGRPRGAPRRSESMAFHAETPDASAATGDGRSPLAAEARELSPEEAAAFGFHEPTAEGGAQTAGPSQAYLDRAAAEVSLLNPDMLVQLDGMAEPVRVGDLLERVKEEAKHDAEGSKLVQAAAACLLRAG